MTRNRCKPGPVLLTKQSSTFQIGNICKDPVSLGWAMEHMSWTLLPKAPLSGYAGGLARHHETCRLDAAECEVRKQCLGQGTEWMVRSSPAFCSAFAIDGLQQPSNTEKRHLCSVATFLLYNILVEIQIDIGLAVKMRQGQGIWGP